MSNVARCRLRQVASCVDLCHYRAQTRLARLARAWRYFMERLSVHDAQRVMLDCRASAGWHPLLVLTVEDTIEQARETFADHPDLPRLIADGCARVGDKWESYRDELYEARRWAIDVAEGYATDEGIMLTRLDDEARAATGEDAP